MNGHPLDLTPTQAAVLAALAAYQIRHGYSPTLKELLGMTGLRSKSYVATVLQALAGKGLLIRAGRKARGVGLTPAGEQWFEQFGDSHRKGEVS